MAVTPDKSTIIFAATGSKGGGVYLLDVKAPDQIAFIMAVSGKVEAIELVNGGADLVVADSTSGAVWYVSDIAGARSVINIAGAKDGLISPTSLRVIQSGRMVIGDAVSKILLVVDLSTLTISKRIQLTSASSVVRQSPDGDTLVVADEQTGRVLLVDPTQDTVYFVPLSR
jgi:hypothetical protein